MLCSQGADFQSGKPLGGSTKIRALQAAEKREFLEGDGLQAVHKCFAVNPALAAEGAAFAPYSTFFRSLFSP